MQKYHFKAKMRENIVVINQVSKLNILSRLFCVLKTYVFGLKVKQFEQIFL